MKRNDTIDWLKFFAAFAVVVIHANSFKEVQLNGWDGEQIDAMFEALSRFAVPYFFMVSGYFLQKKMNATAIRSYLVKLIRLYLTWTGFYLLYDLVILTFNQGDFAAYFRENWTLAKLIYYGNPTSAPHLWYLTATIWGAVILYIFYRKRLLPLLFVISACINIVGILELFSEIPTRDTVFVGLFYLTSGCFLAEYETNIMEKVPRAIYGLIPVFFLLQAWEGLFLFEGDYFFSTIPLTWLLLLWALAFPQKRSGQLFTKIGANSVSIYVLHWFYLSLVRLVIEHFELDFLLESVWWGIGFPIVLFFFSYYATRLGGKT